MAINKVVYGEKTLIDLSGDTVSSEKMLVGTIAHNSVGEKIVGTHECEAGDLTGTGAYVWAIYDTKEKWDYTTKSLSGSTFPNGYESTVYVDWTITEDGYFQVNSGTVSGDKYYLPEGSVDRKAKTILRKGKYSYINPYTVMTIKDAPDTVEGDNLLGYISADTEDTYPSKGVEEDKYYIRIAGPDANVTASKMLSGNVGYTSNGKVTGSIQSQDAQTITPGTADQTIASGKYLSGAQTIKGDANLLSENIKNGISIFGVDGSYIGEDSSVGNGKYIWAKYDRKIGWKETKENTGSTTLPDGFTTTTKYTSRTITEDGYYSLSSSSINLSEYYLPTNTKNGEAKKILYKPYMSNYQIWTLSDEQVELDERGDNLIEYISSDTSDTYPDSGVVDGYYYIKIFSPDVSVQANKMLKGTIACGQNGQIEGTIESIASQKITPSTSNQTIPSGKYLSGTQTIVGDSNLLAENIKKDISIFGVTGTYESSDSSGGANVAQGTITGAGTNAVTIDTGLNNVSIFALFNHSSSSVSGMTSALYLNGAVTGACVNYSQYFKTVGYNVGTFTIDGGNVTYTPKENTAVTGLMQNKEYTWIAIE